MLKKVGRKLLVAVLALSCVVVPMLSAVPVQAKASSETRTVTDATGAKRKVPKNLKKIAVVPLPWSSVIYAIDGTSKRMVSINPGAMSAFKGSMLETLSPEYGKLDTTAISKDFTIDYEKLASEGVQVCVIWDYETDEAKKLEDVGIVPVMVQNQNITQLKKSLKAMGQMLGKEKRANRYIKLYDSTNKSIKAKSDEVKTAKKPKVLYLRDQKLTLQGNDNFIKKALKMGGAKIVGEKKKSLTMEEIAKANPDIIFLSNFDTFEPDDLYKNRIDGQDWSQIKAVKNKKVYKAPMGLYRWDAPGVETPLMMEWIAKIVQPKIFKDINVEKDTKVFFKKNFKMDLTDAQLNQILQKDANAASDYKVK